MKQSTKDEYTATLFIIAFILLIAVCVYFFKQEACNQKSISFEDHRFGIFSGCIVKHQGKWIPLENIRGFGDE